MDETKFMRVGKRKLRIITLLAISCLIFIILLINASAITLIISGENTTDSRVSEETPDTNLGTGTGLKTGKDSGANTRLRVYISVNLSSIPVGATIENAIWYVNLIEIDAVQDQSLRANVTDVNSSWEESGITWNNQPCGANVDNSDKCNLTFMSNISSDVQPPLGWYNFNVTSSIVRALNENRKNASWVLRGRESPPVSSGLLWASREYVDNIALRHYVNISYTTTSDTTFPIVNISLSNSTPIRYQGINISGNITDETGLLFLNLTLNSSSDGTKFFNYSISGTSLKFSNFTNFSGIRGDVINITVYVTDTSNNVKQNSTLFTVADFPVEFVGFDNISDNTYNKNITINWTCNDIDSLSEGEPPTVIGDSINSTVYFDTANPPLVSLYNTSNFNMTTNMTSDGKYFLNVTCFSNNVYAYSSIFNVSLDTSTPTLSNVPVNGTFYNSINNISVTCTDTLLVQEQNTSLYNLQGTLLNSTNTTNISAPSYIHNFTLIPNDVGNDIFNLTTWCGDTKNKDLPIDYVRSGFDGVVQQFNDTISGIQINITFGVLLPNNVFLTLSEDDSSFEKKSKIKEKKRSDDKIEHYETEYNVTLPNLATLQLLNPSLDFTNLIFSMQLKTNAPVAEVKDGLTNHLLIGTGKNKLSFDAEDLKLNGFQNTEFEQIGNTIYLKIPPKNLSYSEGDTINHDPRIDNLNIVEASRTIITDTILPISSDRQPSNIVTYTLSNVNFNITINESNPDKAILLANFSGTYKSNQTSSYINKTKLSFNTTTLSNGNYVWSVLINDSAGNVNQTSNFTMVVSILTASPETPSAPSGGGGGSTPSSGITAPSGFEQLTLFGTEPINNQCGEGQQIFDGRCYNCEPERGYLYFNPDDRSVLCTLCNDGFRMENRECILEEVEFRESNNFRYIDETAKKISSLFNTSNPIIGYITIISTISLLTYNIVQRGAKHGKK